jgi:hypothetical protein
MRAVDRYTRDAARRRAEDDRRAARIVAIVCLAVLAGLVAWDLFGPPSPHPPLHGG